MYNKISKEKYLQLQKSNHIHLLQTYEWGEIKKDKWIIERIEINSYPISIHKRKLPIANSYFGYIPRCFNNQDFDNKKIEEIIRYAKNEKLAFIILEPNQYYDVQLNEQYKNSGFNPNTPTIQPQYTNIIDLNPGKETIWNNYSSSTRRKIRKAEKLGVELKIFDSGDEGLDMFWEVMRPIIERSKFSDHNKDYYKKIWDELSINKMAKIYVPIHEEKILGAYFVAFNDDWTYELYGGIKEIGKNYQTGYYLKWKSIEDSINMGRKYYDQWGVAPYENGEFDQNHSMYGISKFKETFGEEIKKYMPQQIFVNNTFIYKLYNLIIWMNKTKLKISKILKKNK